MLLLLVLGSFFFRGFREAIGLAVAIVCLYLVCNIVVITKCIQVVAHNPSLLSDWHTHLSASFPSLWTMLGVSALVFPQLALGMSGFETGVSVMPLVRGDPNDLPLQPQGRIKNTRKLLVCAAVIMALFLVTSSAATAVLIPQSLYKEGGEANSRALAYLAYKYLGTSFGTLYDVSTVLILWFAGASALAGLLNLMPRYLPRYGMAPEWAKSQRPLVVFFTAVACLITYLFHANVDAQAGAYATGVLVLMSSAGLAVLISVWRESEFLKLGFGAVLLILVYTTAANMIQRPEGLQISLIFILIILAVSLVSRTMRSLELRISSVELDTEAQAIVKAALANHNQLFLLAHRPDSMTSYAAKEKSIRALHVLTPEQAAFIFLEVTLSDPSEFEKTDLKVRGWDIDGFKVLRCSSPAIPNAIAALLLHLRDTTKIVPHIYFAWTEGQPLSYVFKYIFFGEGETAPLVREILREVDKDEQRRPRIIVG
jgi:hypothetical protein